MRSLKELIIYDRTTQFTYKKGKACINHGHVKVDSIKEIRDHVTQEKCFVIFLEDDSEVIWNAQNVGGYRADPIPELADPILELEGGESGQNPNC